MEVPFSFSAILLSTEYIEVKISAYLINGGNGEMKDCFGFLMWISVPVLLHFESICTSSFSLTSTF